MNAATFPIISGNNAPQAAIPADMLQPFAYVEWKEELVAYCSALGARCSLEHVSEERWREWFEAG